MSYFGAALGAAIGMMIGLFTYTNIWRIKSYLPKDYDFMHEWGKTFLTTDNKAYTYTVRLFVGIIFHPIVFVFVWGREGLLKINLNNNDVLSAIVLLLIEAVIFSIAIWFDIVKIRPPTLKTRIITLQIGIHLLIGILMGYFYSLL
ncbi:MAG: hypothetical protein ACXAD7_20945 [Candidatus Kariarchaeaceae archaeon]|jgi:hypothetical protein